MSCRAAPRLSTWQRALRQGGVCPQHTRVLLCPNTLLRGRDVSILGVRVFFHDCGASANTEVPSECTLATADVRRWGDRALRPCMVGAATPVHRQARRPRATHTPFCSRSSLHRARHAQARLRPHQDLLRLACLRCRRRHRSRPLRQSHAARPPRYPPLCCCLRTAYPLRGQWRCTNAMRRSQVACMRLAMCSSTLCAMATAAEAGSSRPWLLVAILRRNQRKHRTTSDEGNMSGMNGVMIKCGSFSLAW